MCCCCVCAGSAGTEDVAEPGPGPAAPPKEAPNMGLTGKLAAETNKVGRGIGQGNKGQRPGDRHHTSMVGRGNTLLISHREIYVGQPHFFSMQTAAHSKNNLRICAEICIESSIDVYVCPRPSLRTDPHVFVCTPAGYSAYCLVFPPPPPLPSPQVGGTVLKHVPPPEAQRPDKKWRLYVFKGGQIQDDPFYLHRCVCGGGGGHKYCP